MTHASWRAVSAIEPEALTQARGQCRRGARWLARLADAISPSRAEAPPLVWSDIPLAADAFLHPLAAPVFRFAAPIALAEPFPGRTLTAAYAPLENRLWLKRDDLPAEAVGLDRRDDETILAALRAVFARLGGDPTLLGEAEAGPALAAALAVVPARDIAPPDAVERLVNMLSNAAALLSAQIPSDDASFRMRPDDLAMTLGVAPADDASRGVEAGLGFAASNAVPYLFAAPVPPRSTDSLGPPPAGLVWRVDGGVTALIAPVATIMAERDGEDRAAALLDTAIAHCWSVIARKEVA